MDKTLRVFIGFDHRQPVAFTVLAHSIIAKASQPVSIIPIVLQTLPIRRAGLTPFTFSRFLVPWLCDYKGTAIFLDADTLLRGDICEMLQCRNRAYPPGEPEPAVWVVKHEGKLAFERPAVMLFDCGHPANQMLTPEVVEKAPRLHQFDWLGGPDSPLIGSLDPGWNYLEHYQEVPFTRKSIKLVHYTQGIPNWPETRDGPFSEDWNYYKKISQSSMSWTDLMGTSVHAPYVQERLEKAREQTADK